MLQKDIKHLTSPGDFPWLTTRSLTITKPQCGDHYHFKNEKFG